MSWSSQDTSDSDGIGFETELSRTSQTLVEIASQKVRCGLRGYAHCKSREEANDWQLGLMDSLIEACDVVPEYGGSSNRAVCPLCGFGVRGRCNEGFTPEGLRRHLSGRGNLYKCPIMGTTMLLATKHWDEQFREAELAEKKITQAELTARLKVETLYKVGPFGEAELANSKFLKGARDAEGMLWAEDRLKSLGFQIVKEDRTKAYINERTDVVVYADPRIRGEIGFSVYMLPLNTKPGRRVHQELTPRFRMFDSWKNDLLRKYEFRITQRG